MTLALSGRVLVLVPVLLVALAIAGPPRAAAQSSSPPTVLVVLDASGSMARTGPDGIRLMDAAKAAVGTVVEELGDDAVVGLRAYGHRVGNDDEDKPEGCVDTELLVPPTASAGPDVQRAADALEPSGWTALGTAMNAAVDDLDGAGRATVIVVSDGEDNCQPPDPCEAASIVAASGTQVVVDTVGILLDTDEARSQLSCMADAGGGEFVATADAESLADAMRSSATRVVERAAAAERADGTGDREDDPVEGTATTEPAPEPSEPVAIEGSVAPGDAPRLEPGRTHVQRVGGSVVLWYDLGPLQAGDDVAVEVRREPVDPPSGDDHYVLVAGEVRDGDEPIAVLRSGRVDADAPGEARMDGLSVPSSTDEGRLRLDVTMIPDDDAPAQDLFLLVEVQPDPDPPVELEASPDAVASPVAAAAASGQATSNRGLLVLALVLGGLLVVGVVVGRWWWVGSDD